MQANIMRLVGIVQPAAWAPAVGGAFRSCSSIRSDDLRGTNKSYHVWDQVLRSAQSSPEKLRDIVDTLTKHCIITNTAPPLEPYNELLRICHMRSDVALIQKLVHMGYTVNMHFDETTHQRFYSSFNLESSSHNYFTHPFPGLAHSTISSSSSASSSIQQGSAAGAGLDAGADVHGGFGRIGFVQSHQPEGHNHPQASLHQQQQQHGPHLHQQQQSRGWRVFDRHDPSGTHGGRMDD